MVEEKCALIDDIGWHFGTPRQDKSRNSILSRCGKVMSCGITRLKDHLARIPGEVTGCGKVATLVRENMMELMRENKVKKKDLRKRKEEFMSGLKEGMNMMKFKISWMRMHI